MGRFAEIDAGLRAPPHVHGSKTSLAAAVSISGNSKSMRQRVENYIRAHPEGVTDEQMQIALDMKQSSQRPRRCELVDAGIIRDSGYTSLTTSGRKAVRWVLA